MPTVATRISPVDSVPCDILAVGVTTDKPQNETLQVLDKKLDGMLAPIIGRFDGKKGSERLIHTFDRLPSKHVLVIGLGQPQDLDLPDLRTFASAAVQRANKEQLNSLGIALPTIVSTSNVERAVEFLAEGALLGSYRFDTYKSDPDEEYLNEIHILSDVAATHTTRATVHAEAVNYARDLVNRPGSDLTPPDLAAAARHLAKTVGLECRILGPQDLMRNNMNLLLAVGRAGSAEPQLIHLTYRPRQKSNRVVALIGKGITFDSGGLSIKPSASMIDMKADMAGAATVLGAVRAAAQLQAGCEIHAIVPAAENMVSANSYKLGDVIRGASGKSVEIHNTDAEGRLALADALAYAQTVKPDEIVDVATLTGACMVALGPHMAGIMGTDPQLVSALCESGKRSGEAVWHLPLPNQLRSMLESSIADLKNVGERWGGALTAGLFLREFVPDGVRWAHMDIAGPAFAEKSSGHVPRGGTGFGVLLLSDYLRTPTLD